MNLAALENKPTLQGARIRLEPLGIEHLDGFVKQMQDPDLDRLTGSHGGNPSLEVGRQWLSTRKGTKDRLDLAIIETETGDFAGEIVLNDLSTANESCNLRLWLGASFRDHGYGSEAIRLVLAYAFDVVGLHRVELEVYAFNQRAIRTYERCGFEVEGRLRHALLWEGERYDALIMGILNEAA
ncbi:GNAT family N-acetyltransferase [Tenggerimyces flavus]|uniref:GNAT family N-acetyltransferase n=1 Tax=Tenggerimyces flavus TaxID=1708749 RepID=A0ABV7YAH4_9ACTN|nr:GNAT family protein [Tenggerimyces flavus]MBM7785597.1 RimJ/RimL family protein N-acetyltransferase [Tenggerimyces flavus]